MKNPVFKFTAALCFLALALGACKKDEIKFEDQIAGRWLSSSVKSDSVDVTNFYTFDLQLNTDRKFSLSLKTKNLLTGQTDTQTTTGTWSADHVNEDFTLKFSDNSNPQTYTVTYVDEVRMLTETTQNEKHNQITFEKK